MTKYQKMPILHHISANSHTCGLDARTFVGSKSSLEVTPTVCHNLGFLRFSLPKIGGWANLTNSKFFFSFSKVISCCLMAVVADLKWRQQCDTDDKNNIVDHCV